MEGIEDLNLRQSSISLPPGFEDEGKFEAEALFLSDIWPTYASDREIETEIG